MKYYTPNEILRVPVNCRSMRMALCGALLFLCALWLPRNASAVGFWTAVSTQPADGIGVCLLLPDGTVLAEGAGADWFALTPDGNGHYANGSWSTRNPS